MNLVKLQAGAKLELLLNEAASGQHMFCSFDKNKPQA
jgi:hypothetical protein